MKDMPRENFRWAAHTGGLAILKAKDYEPGEEITAGNPYECWRTALEAGTPLRPGDVLQRIAAPESGFESSPGELLIAKYIGFEPAQWFVPEPKLSELRPDGLANPGSPLPKVAGTAENLSL